jgi:catechol 2,3-dioxygenase-like lactoylglutathione lyase family enzyme
MLNRITAVPTVAVKDLKRARRFYEEVLGLKPSGVEESDAIAYGNGGSGLFVYESRYAGTNQATAVTWIAGDGVDDAVRTLKGKGVAFEHYDLPGMKREGDVHVAGNMRAAWFKDPDGNIHALSSQ